MQSLGFRESKPIYEQIKDYIKKLALSDALKADEKLPSVRELAMSKSLNPNTIQRAYKELEAEGYIYTIPGKGSFISTGRDVSEEKKDMLVKRLEECVWELLYIGVDKDTIIKMIDGCVKKQ